LYGDDVVRQYDDFAAWAGDESPVFADWARGVARDGEVLALVRALPDRKRQPNLVFAAARWHGAEAGPYPRLRSVLLERWEEVRATVLARSTQTNEVGRCATLLPLLAAVPGPVALVEVGASAGLCLHPDRWSYRYSNGVALDPPAGPSPVVLSCEVSGDPPLPDRLPEVVWRAGLDLNPIDLRDDDAVAWLQALVWPGQEDRRARLAAAIEVARTDPPYLVRGNLLDGLPALLSEAPAGATVVVQHTAVAFYLEPPDRDRFDAMMRGLVGEGAVHWISNEGPGVLPRVTGRAQPPDGLFVLGYDGRPVGWTHGHGRSLHWLGDA
jgi:hypothetical protein